MKKLLNYRLTYFILGALIFSTISSVLAYSYVASDFGISKTDTSWRVDNAKTALDDIRSTYKISRGIYITVQAAAWDYSGRNGRAFFPIPAAFNKFRISRVDNVSSSYCNIYAQVAPDNHQEALTVGVDYDRATHPNIYVDMKTNSSSYTTCSMIVYLYSTYYY